MGDKSIIDGCDAADETLTPDECARLGELALLSENLVELGDSLAEASRTLTVLIERHPEFHGASGELRTKMTLLQELQAELGRTVMRFSLRYEDTVAGASRRTKNTRSRRNSVAHQ